MEIFLCLMNIIISLLNVYQFSQQVFAKDWNPEFAFRAVSPESIAEYVSSHRLGEHKKMSLIILDQAGHVTGNVFLPWTKLTDVDSHKNIMTNNLLCQSDGWSLCYLIWKL